MGGAAVSWRRVCARAPPHNPSLSKSQMLRAVTLVCCTLLFGGALRGSVGDVAAAWLCTTWVSTVVMGTPLLRAVLGPAYAPLGVVAGISSYIFQLPLMLFLFEVDAWRRAKREQQAGQQQQESRDGEGGSKEGSARRTPTPSTDAAAVAVGALDVRASGGAAEDAPPSRTRRWRWACGWLPLVGPQQRERLALRLLTNHVLWGVGIGVVLSLSKIGPKWLNPGTGLNGTDGPRTATAPRLCAPTYPARAGTPPAQRNPTFCPWVAFISVLLDYFARCTEPVAFFATGEEALTLRPAGWGAGGSERRCLTLRPAGWGAGGSERRCLTGWLGGAVQHAHPSATTPAGMWMVGRSPLACGAWQAALYMVAKLVLLPLLAVGCAAAVGLGGASARAAVLLAALPISPAAFAVW